MEPFEDPQPDDLKPDDLKPDDLKPDDLKPAGLTAGTRVRLANNGSVLPHVSVGTLGTVTARWESDFSGLTFVDVAIDNDKSVRGWLESRFEAIDAPTPPPPAPPHLAPSLPATRFIGKSVWDSDIKVRLANRVSDSDSISRGASVIVSVDGSAEVAIDALTAHGIISALSACIGASAADLAWVRRLNAIRSNHELRRAVRGRLEAITETIAREESSK